MIEEKKRNSKIIAISNKYKNILDDLIDNSYPNFLLGLINKKSRNMPRFKGNLINLLKENSLDKNILAINKSL